MQDGESRDERDILRQWQLSPLGLSLLEQEYRLVESSLAGVFGEQCLQLGGWGEPAAFLRHARTQHGACLSSRDGLLAAEHPGAVGLLHRLPVASDSVDAILLPHSLDFTSRPHAILREVHRVLRADGHLIILGFKPGGLWGLRRLIPGAAMPPAIGSMISDSKLCDWLQLLDLHIHGVQHYFFRWPLPGNRSPVQPKWEERGRRWWPELAACYMLSAQKRVVPLTTVRRPWRAKPKVVGGLAEPTS